MPQIKFLSTDGTKHWDIEAPIGISVMDTAVTNGIDMEGTCEGNMACSTCHVIIATNWDMKLTPPVEEEEDMLDLVYGLTRTSRLCCQIIMTEDLDGLTVRLPGERRNLLG